MDALTRLREEESRLESLLQGRTEEQGPGSEQDGELSKIDQHPADLGTEVFEREKDESLAHQVEEELAEIRAAIKRVDAGTYGVCERCGKPIGDARLDAIPWTRLCIDDQAATEGTAAGR